MNVTLLDYTGCNSTDPAKYAAKLLIYTKNTRLEQNTNTREGINLWSAEKIAEELNYIANTIRSSWEFIDYTFQITGVSRAFTHQFVRTRTGSYAQQSMRSVDMSGGFETIRPRDMDPAEDEVWDRCLGAIASAYRNLRDLGLRTEDARGLLPTNISTNIIAKFNLRTLADLVGKRDNPRAQGEYTDVIRLMVGRVLDVHPWTKVFLHPERANTPALNRMLLEALDGATPHSRQAINDALKELDLLKGTWG